MNSEIESLKIKCHNKPFWVWEEGENHKQSKEGDCCFNHIIGLPSKHGEDKPIFEYEKEIFYSILNHKRVWIKKATGLGITEFMLRFMAFLALSGTKKNTDLNNAIYTIVTGPRIELAIDLVSRFKKLFERIGITFEDKQTVVNLGSVKIEAFPSHHLDAMRGLDNVRFILLDEADFFPKGQQQDARDVSERYIGKSDTFIAMVSTPNAPNGLFEHIEKEPEETCLYKRLLFDYTYGIDKIYSPQDIIEAKRSPSFDREYNLKYLGKIGNVFSRQDIDTAVSREYDPNNATDAFIGKALGVDPGFGSSATGLVLQQWKDGHSQIILAEQFERASISDMVNTIYKLTNKHHITKIFVDASQPGFIKDLKRALREYEHYEKYSREELQRMIYKGNMRVCPVSFGAGNGKEMLHHAKRLMEKHLIKIHPDRFDKLITSLRTAYEEDGELDKEQTSFDDILDAFRLCLQNVVLSKG